MDVYGVSVCVCVFCFVTVCVCGKFWLFSAASSNARKVVPYR